MNPSVMLGLSSAAILASIAFTLGVQASPAQDPTPTFRAGVRLIDVDVIVTDRDGNPVRGLTEDDFEIIDDGQRQAIRTFSAIDLPFEPPAMLAERRARHVEPDVATNVLPEGRSFVLLIDIGGQAQRARSVAERWLDEVVQPGDRVAVVHTEGTYRSAQTFTSSRRLILDSNKRIYDGSRDRRPPWVQSVDTLRVIEELSKKMGSIAGRRKAIVWLAPNLDLYPPEQEQGRPLSAWQQAMLASMPVVWEAWRDAARAAVDNNVAVYPVDPGGLTTSLGMGELKHQASLREVAYDTGGVPIGSIPIRSVAASRRSCRMRASTICSGTRASRNTTMAGFTP